MLWALVMAGGQGTRFWPESRTENPKQFLRIFGCRSLLEQTVDRLQGVIPPSRILVVTQDAKVSQAARFLAIPHSQILGEPVGRNTAPCAALVASIVIRKDPEAVLAILPADHRIEKVGYFRTALRQAADIAWRYQFPVTFGIQPDFPHTGYGYLETDKLVGRKDGFKIYRLKKFHEKPDVQRARAFLRTGRFYWNSGMFVWRADKLLEATNTYLPSAYDLAVKITDHGIRKGMKRFYRRMPNISIDYGLMEKLRGKILTLPVDMGWSDVGDWKVAGQFWPKDRDQNAVLGKAIFVDSSGNVVKSRKRLIALVGIRDHIVIDTLDALLVAHKDKTELIRKVVEQLKTEKQTRYL
ncbi:MAG: sugar phosphate nucleotidyltransferase [Candidatus Omnitrophica bacterium]|nr:sugar phosphate nucleotidyltransferase [Candidatus Omnitrophota bacterium]